MGCLDNVECLQQVGRLEHIGVSGTCRVPATCWGVWNMLGCLEQTVAAQGPVTPWWCKDYSFTELDLAQFRSWFDLAQSRSWLDLDQFRSWLDLAQSRPWLDLNQSRCWLDLHIRKWWRHFPRLQSLRFIECLTSLPYTSQMWCFGRGRSYCKHDTRHSIRHTISWYRR